MFSVCVCTFEMVFASEKMTFKTQWTPRSSSILVPSKIKTRVFLTFLRRAVIFPFKILRFENWKKVADLIIMQERRFHVSQTIRSSFTDIRVFSQNAKCCI